MKSINKAFDILEVLLVNPDSEQSLSEICESTGLNKSSANRIIAILVNRGYVSQKEKRGKYELSTKFLTSSVRIRQYKRLKEIAHPYLVKLGHSVDESIGLAIQDKNNAYMVDVIPSSNVLTTVFGIGSILPLYCTSVGKIFLANMTEAELEAYLANVELTKKTDDTITDVSHLKASLKMVKEEGVAYDIEENWLGVGSVSVGIYDNSRNIVATIVIVGPYVRLTRGKMSDLLPDIKNCATEITRALD
jgi:DNA-binding IclR family transcriptional regulator